MTTGARLEIRHTTGYQYESDVTASYNEIRLSPVQTAQQSVLHHRIEIRPNARTSRFEDYWGSVVHAFDLQRAHRELTITATSTVETSDTACMPPAGPVSWADLADIDCQDRWCEFLMATDYTAPDAAIGEIAGSVRAAADPVDAVKATVEHVRTLVSYEKGATDVGTTAAEALAARAGVCQDFVHIGLAVLRRAGIPCRYASGYLLPQSDAAIGQTVAGESHAWLEAWIGDWYAVDPTNGDAVGPAHVLVARGRDYGDVPPLRGVYHGGRAEALEVSVEITRRA